jgi:hypothetical protein
MDFFSLNSFREQRPAADALICKTNPLITGSIFLLFAGGSAASLYFAITKHGIFYYFAIVSLLFSWFYLGPLRAALRKETNWIFIWDLSFVWIQFRSYLNSHFPGDRFSILRLDRSEIEWVRIVKQTNNVPSSRGIGSQISFHRFLEIKLHVSDTDLDQIEKKLKEDLYKEERPHGFRYVHYPVALKKENRSLWVDWQSIYPSLGYTTKILSRTFSVIDLLKNNRGSWRELDKKETDDLVIELVQFGKDFDAIRLLRRKNKMELTEAKKFIEELRTNSKKL